MTDKILVVCTCDSQERGALIARTLVEKQVAACVNILSGMQSVYRWKDKIEDAPEWLLVIKSRRDLFPLLRAEIERIHTYQVPEIIAIPVVDGSEAYLSWLDQSLIKVSE